MSDFANCILENCLVDIGFTGNPYTWERPDGLRKRLDRILFNTAWGDSFTCTSVSDGMLKHSDHRPLHNETLSSSVGMKGSFKF